MVEPLTVSAANRTAEAVISIPREGFLARN
jgi:hypothetical protein